MIGMSRHGGNGTGGGSSRRGKSPWAREEDDGEAARQEPGPGPRSQEILQINIRGDAVTIERFKRLCRDDRRTYADMLRILMESFEAKGRGDD